MIIVDWPTQDLRVTFCDVGQGDAILIQKGFRQILVDSGANNSVINCLERELPFWDSDIELVIATHADKDHIGGFKSVLNEFFVKEMITTSVGKKTDVFLAFNEAVQREINEGMTLSLIDNEQTIKIGDNFSITNVLPQVADIQDPSILGQNTETQLWDKIEAQLAKMEEQNLDHNSLSIVSFIKFGDFKVLLTGDLEEEGEQALIDRGLIDDVNVLKVGHHGSKNGTSDEFLRHSQPEISIISVGENNNYGHPNPQVLAKLEQFGSKILRTDLSGPITIVSNGHDYWVE